MEKFKRHTVYPIVLGVAKLVDGNDFNLQIDGVAVKSAKEIITEDTIKRDVILFDIAVQWNGEIQGNEDEYEDLLIIANKYFIDDNGTQNEIVEDVVVI